LHSARFCSVHDFIYILVYIAEILLLYFFENVIKIQMQNFGYVIDKKILFLIKVIDILSGKQHAMCITRVKLAS